MAAPKYRYLIQRVNANIDDPPYTEVICYPFQFVIRDGVYIFTTGANDLDGAYVEYYPINHFIVWGNKYDE